MSTARFNVGTCKCREFVRRLLETLLVIIYLTYLYKNTYMERVNYVGGIRLWCYKKMHRRSLFC